MRMTIVGLALGAWMLQAGPGWSATYPGGFRETLVTSSLAQPTHFAIAPDGRLFVAEKQGRVRVVKNGALLGTPVLTVTVHTERYRGIMGIALDRAFAANGYLYIYYTTTTPTIHNRISRFTIVGDTAAAGSERILFEQPTSASAAHNGGALAMGTDGRIYAGSGDDNTGSNAQTLSTIRGKILRLNADGTIPSDNPFLGSTTGLNQSIWAMGVRQPWSITFDPELGSMMIQDVGSTMYEEVNVGRIGANYGHPTTEGPTTDPRFDAPLHSYRIGGSGTTGGCAAIGGAFYRPAAVQFPASYVGRYFFADHCNGWMKTIDPASGNAVAVFATGMLSGDGSGVSDIQVAPDGSLYYVLHSGRLYRVTYDSTVPTPTPTPTGAPTPTPTPTPATTPTPTPGSCRVLVGGGSWLNAGFPSQSGTFTYQFDATPSTTTLTALAGLSRDPASSAQRLMAGVRFGSDGYITMRDGSNWRSATPMRYFAGMQYHFRMVVNVASDTYTVHVKPLGEGEVLLGSGYRLRFDVSSLQNFAAGVSSSRGTFEVCNRVWTTGP